MPELETPVAPTEQAEGGATSTEQATAAEGTTTVTETAAKAASAGESTGVEAPVVPEYTLQLPEGSPLDAAALERTAATARELGLSAESAQKVAERLSTEVATRVEAERESLLAAYSPGGEKWQEQVDGWKAEALADPALGKTADERTATISKGHGVMLKYAEQNPADAENMTAFLNNSGLGNHPAAVRFFAWIGKAMGEGQMVMPGAASGSEKTTAELLYGSTVPNP